MRPLVCIYCEGSDSKIAVIEREKGAIKLLKTASISMIEAHSSTPKGKDSLKLDMEGMGDNFSIESFSNGESSTSDISEIASELVKIPLNQADFIAVATDPSISYHYYEGKALKEKTKTISLIQKDILKLKGISAPIDSIDFIEFDEKTLLAAFIEGSIPGIDIINSLAAYNKKRFYKVAGIKSAELALQYFIAKNSNFYPEDFSLIIHTGKEYSKLIFMQGKKIKHLGATLDVGIRNLHSYDVYFSKILLEMENGGIPRLDNVIICGDDNSENLVLSFYGSFPEANVSELKFNSIDVSNLADEEKKTVSSFTIPIAAAIEYFDEQDKKHIGINLLPKHIKDNQKLLQFGWHSWAVLPILFFVTYYITITIAGNFREIKQLDTEIAEYTQKQIENQAILDQIMNFDNKITNFGSTQAILDSASHGAEIWSKTIDDVSNFVERRRNFWISSINCQEQEVVVKGYTLSRRALTEFAEFTNSSTLKNMSYEPKREMNTYSFLLNFKLFKEPGK